MRSLTCVWTILCLGTAAFAWGHKAVWVQNAVNAVNIDSTYASDAVSIQGNPLPAVPLGSYDAGNWGATPLLEAGRMMENVNRILLRFPLVSLPGPIHAITRARLILSLYGAAHLGMRNRQVPVPLSLQLYRITPANATWTEGTSNLGAPLSGVVCWGWRQSPATPWAGCKGCGLAGTDFFSEPISTATLSSASWPEGQPLIFEINDPSFLLDWIAHPANNAGFLLRSSTLENLDPAVDTVGLYFFSDDCNDPLDRPRLEIEYDRLPPDARSQVVYQQGLAASVPDSAYDTLATSLDSGSDGSYGGAPDFRVGVDPGATANQPWRALLKFDLSRGPARVATARALRLTLTVQGTLGDAQTLTAFHLLWLHSVSQANAAWREGISAAGALESGAASWNWLSRGRTPWAGGNPLGAPLLPYGSGATSQPLASLVVVPAELHDGDTLTFDIPNPALLAGWIAHPETNGGFLLNSPTLEVAAPSARGQIRFYSDDSTWVARRPRLDLYYDPRAAAADPAWLFTK